MERVRRRQLPRGTRELVGVITCLQSRLKMILVGNGPIHVVWNKPVLWSKSGSCGEIICIVGQVCALWAIWGVQVIFMGFDREGVIQFCVL